MHFFKRGFAGFSCTDFIIFFLTINFYLKSKTNKYLNFKKIIFFFKPFTKKVITYLRAPYRYKMARNQVLFSRFFINIRFIFTQEKKYLFIDTSGLLHFVSICDGNLPYMTTNICNLTYSRILFYFSVKNLFKYN